MEPKCSLSQLARRAHEGDDDENAPQPEDDARNGGEHLDQRAKDDRQTRRQEILREEDRDRDADESADQQREKRTIKSAPDLRQNPKRAFCTSHCVSTRNLTPFCWIAGTAW